MKSQPVPATIKAPEAKPAPVTTDDLYALVALSLSLALAAAVEVRP